MEREDEGTVSMGGDGQGTARGLTRKRSTPTWGAWAVGRHALALQRSLVGVQLAVGRRARFRGDRGWSRSVRWSRCEEGGRGCLLVELGTGVEDDGDGRRREDGGEERKTTRRLCGHVIRPCTALPTA